VRVDRLIESVSLMKALFTGEPVHHAGEHYRLDLERPDPVPVQRPHPPLLIGGAQRRMLTFAGREADIVSISPGLAARAFGVYEASMTVEENTDRQLEWVRAGAGDRFDEVELSVVAMPARVTDKPREAAAQIAPNLGLTPDEVLRSVHVLLGSVGEICETLQARRERWGISNVVVPWQFADAFAPVIARLAGT
jgi:alkanesulfonate monooxygenase SsuD/methylene tetrahydromethanopterin reductase-like flavin-dependent oxidoreductase (luciferase family)